MESFIEKMNKFGISTSTIQTGVYKVKGDETNGVTLRQFTVSVVLLDDTSQKFILDKKAKGADLLEMVFQHLELREREYFGLVFCEGGSVLASGPAPDVTRWLDPAKLIRKIDKFHTKPKIFYGIGA